MRQIWAAACLVTFLLVGQATAADQPRRRKPPRARRRCWRRRPRPRAVRRYRLRPRSSLSPKRRRSIRPAKSPWTMRSPVLPAASTGRPGARVMPSMEAIANVVMNRVGHEGFPNTICGVVKQGHEQGACQFSWWCDGRSDDAEEEESYSHAKEIARKALNRQLKDRTGGALYFHHRKVAPNWSKEYIKTVEIGEHLFYKPAGGKAK